MRKILVNEKIYEFKVGKSYVIIKSPEGKRVSVFCADLKGQNPSDFERGQWKRTSDGMVKPGHIRGYIKKVGL